MIELLLALITAITGIGRPVDAQLTDLAQQRAVEIQSSFEHRYLGELSTNYSAWGEVLAWRRSGEPLETKTRAIPTAWHDSPPHWTVLTDRNLTHIGCGISTAGETAWFVCLVATPNGASPRHTPLHSAAPRDTPITMPNTSIE